MSKDSPRSSISVYVILANLSVRSNIILTHPTAGDRRLTTPFNISTPNLPQVNLKCGGLVV